MKFDLTSKEIELLEKKGVFLDEAHDYTDDEAIVLLEQVRDIEIAYSQFTTRTQEELYFQYSNLADKIHSQIPEE